MQVAKLAAKFMEERVLTYSVDPVTKQPTWEQDNFRCPIRPLDPLFGDLPATEFGPAG